MSVIKVDIVSAEGKIHQGEALLVAAPAEMGEVGIAPRHAPLLTQLRPGEVRVNTPEGETLHFFVGGGVLEVQPDLVTILADTAMRGADADEAAAIEAKRRAEEAMQNASSEMDLAKAQSDLVEAAARMEFVKKMKGASH
jgi:F-type H+-transporting ATPase subunit epsilon